MSIIHECSFLCCVEVYGFDEGCRFEEEEERR